MRDLLNPELNKALADRLPNRNGQQKKKKKKGFVDNLFDENFIRRHQMKLFAFIGVTIVLGLISEVALVYKFTKFLIHIL